ncbi:hypothetical protein [Streptomyces sp. NPDC098781]|uniref:hypothetical protein n=1 Tax=Streptomyces sp. NPDC098781 TaxID=3366097 RepID=UPI00381D3BCE
MNHAQLIALGRSLRVADEHGQRLTEGDAPPATEEISRDLQRAVDLLSEAVTAPRPSPAAPSIQQAWSTRTRST